MSGYKHFVVGPAMRICNGVVGEAELVKWKKYLEREGQPPLNAPTEARLFLRAQRVLPPNDPAVDIEFRLELFQPKEEWDVLEGGLTWRRYFREVHQINVEGNSMGELIRALEAAGWPKEKVDRFRQVHLDDELPPDCEEEKEYNQKLADEILNDEPETKRGLLGPTEWAWGLLQEATASFPEENAEGDVVGGLRFEPEDAGLRTVHALGKLTLSAVQELLNSVGSGVQVEFEDDPGWQCLDHPLVMQTRNAEIAAAVVDRAGFKRRERKRAIEHLMCPWVAGRFRKNEHLADVHWTQEVEGSLGCGRAWFDLGKTMEEFRETCRRFTFEDYYDHGPVWHQAQRRTANYDAYRVWLFEIDLARWAIRPMINEIYLRMQQSPHCLERWIAVFPRPTPSSDEVACLSRGCCMSAGLPYVGSMELIG